jgi:hypothetical protein
MNKPPQQRQGAFSRSGLDSRGSALRPLRPQSQPNMPATPFAHGPTITKRQRAILDAINQRRKVTERLPGGMTPAQPEQQPAQRRSKGEDLI